MQKTIAATLAATGLLMLAPRAAHAQDTDGAFQIGLGTDIVAHTSGTLKIHDLPVVGDREADVSATRWGFGARNSVNLEAGYGITDSMVIGGLLLLGGYSQTTETNTIGNAIVRNEQSQFDLALMPKFDYMFLPGGVARPFLGAALGLVMTKGNTRDTSGNVVDDVDTSATGFGLLARAGVRWFPTPGLSFDPALAFGWQTLSGSYEPTGASYDVSASGWTLGLSLAASGWIK